jgi:ABC-type Fe3+ transport system permease subunit
LGANPFQAWRRVEWPRIREQAYWMMALVFGLSLSEVSTVILFSRGDFEPLSVWIQNQMSRFQFNSALEGTLLLIGVSILALRAGFGSRSFRKSRCKARPG